MSARRGSRFVRRATLSGDTTTVRGLVTQPSGVTLHQANKTLELSGLTLASTLVSQTTAELKALRFTNSGATFMPSGITLPAFDWGQGIEQKIYRGVHALTAVKKPAATYNTQGGTTLSDGTIQFLTGLTTISNLTFSFQTSTVTPGDHGYPEMIYWKSGYTNSAGGVTMTLWATIDGITYSACTPGNTHMGTWTGCSINWVAIGV